MITGTIKNKIDKIWTDIWAGGISNPLTVIEQLTYLMFIRSLDEKELAAEEFENDTGEKQPAPPMVKMKRPQPPKPAPIGKSYVCGGCGYEYNPELGDPESEVAPGTLFDKLPEEWVCPECGEGRDQFIEA